MTNSSTWRPFVHSVIGAAAVASLMLLAACAVQPLQIDRSARAPVLSGFGASSLAITTRSADARRLFDQGMAQAYGFNEVEAIRAFKAALAQDPACAMCAWGVAWQLGPNINDPDRQGGDEGRRYAAYALGAAAGLAPRERGLIEAMNARYSADAATAREAAVLAAPVCGAGGANHADPKALVYADRMRALVERYPDDPDIVALYADAEMIATRVDNWWDPQTGAPAGHIGTMTDRIEAALKTHPDHIGLNHFMIHAVDAPNVAQRAEAAADRLALLAPKSPHLLHMPAHTYLRIGRYADAARLNVAALAADDAFDAELARQGFAPSKDWRGHNAHFLWYATLMQGRGDMALQVARLGASKMTGAGEYAEYVRSSPSLTLLRLERWGDLLKEPMPSGDKGLAAVLGAYTHGVAFARTGQPARAAESLARLEPTAATLLAAHASEGYFDKMIRGIVGVAQERLRAEVAWSGQHDVNAAVAHEREALVVGKELDEDEPPTLGAGTRLALGDIQLRAKRWADAEHSFRADLADHPKSGWALRGLVRSLQAQGRRAEADALVGQLDVAWQSADPGLRGAFDGS